MYWRIEEGDMCVAIGHYVEGGICHFSTLEIIDQNETNLGEDRAASLIGELMLQLGRGCFGYNRFAIHHEGGYRFERKHYDLISGMLADEGYVPVQSRKVNESLWVRSRLVHAGKIVRGLLSTFTGASD